MPRQPAPRRVIRDQPASVLDQAEQMQGRRRMDVTALSAECSHSLKLVTVVGVVVFLGLVTGCTAASNAGTSAAEHRTPTAASLSGKCVTGWVTLDPHTGQAISFVSFAGAFTPGPNVRGGYRLTLTNDSSAKAEVTGFKVVFYYDGQETGSADVGPFDEFITKGHSLTWTKATNMMNVGRDGAVDTAATCALGQWDHRLGDNGMCGSSGLARTTT